MNERYDERYRQDPYRSDRGHGREERGFMDRAGDEVRTWFGDEDAERRRRYDDQQRQREHQRDENFGRDQHWRSGGGGREWESRESTYGRGQSGDRGWLSEARHSEPSRSGQASASSQYGSPSPYGMSGRGYGGSYGGSSAGSYGGGYGGGYGGDRNQGGFAESGGQGQQQHYGGKRPKGYQRSDTRITEDVCDRLADSWDVDASDIEVSVANGEVTLSGTVRDRDQKRRAEDLVESLSGVREVNNQLRVSRAHSATSSTGGTASDSTATGDAGNRLSNLP